MGNTGGDNRVEFGYRAPHAIWYNSPNWSGFSFSAMYGPGQNRSSSGDPLGGNSNLASAEQDCAGGNIPGSGALTPACTDGSFGNLYSVNAEFTWESLYVFGAYEEHVNVNRISDTIGFPTTPPADTQGDPNDVANETAWKVGAQYTFATKTTLGGIYEKFKRNVPQYLEYQNERQRDGYWVVLSQALTEKDVISAGWAHAGSTPGDVGTHNTPGGANPDNQANMYTIAWKHLLDRATTVYADYAMTKNHPDAHYDLGAGGHANTTDCHDATQEAAFDPTTGGGRRDRRRPALLCRRQAAGILGRRAVPVLGVLEPARSGRDARTCGPFPGPHFLALTRTAHCRAVWRSRGASLPGSAS